MDLNVFDEQSIRRINNRCKLDDKIRLRLLNPEIKKLKRLGITEVHLNDIDPMIAFEIARTIAVSCMSYPAITKVLNYVGTTQALYEKEETCYNQSFMKAFTSARFTKEQALKLSNLMKPNRTILLEEEMKFHPNFLIPNPSKKFSTISFALNNFRSLKGCTSKFSSDNFTLYNAITINESNAMSYELLNFKLKDDVQNDLHPLGANSPAGLTAHEIGHVIQLTIKLNKLDNSKPYRKIEKLFKKGPEFITKNLCKAASENIREFFATAFASYSMSKEAGPLALEVGELIDECMHIVKIRNKKI